MAALPFRYIQKGRAVDFISGCENGGVNLRGGCRGDDPGRRGRGVRHGGGLMDEDDGAACGHVRSGRRWGSTTGPSARKEDGRNS